MGTRILIVDDDPSLRKLLSRYLEEQGFEVETLGDASGIDLCLQRQSIDLIILDIMMPGEDGLSAAKRLKGYHAIPIIILSAKGEDIDRIIGLEVGADDYLPKPFNPRELLARIKAVLRRIGDAATPAEPPAEYTFGDYLLNKNTRQLFKQGKELTITNGEYKLLELFITHPNRVMDRDFIMEQLKGFTPSPFDRSIDVRVNRLRQKIEKVPTEPRYIKTVWGEGYLFNPNPVGDRRKS